jgi:trehalose 6-phosphate synthase
MRYRDREVLVTAHPIAVDTADFEQLAKSDAVLQEERLLTRRRPEKLIVRVDRTDPSKNVVRGFRAYELYLDAHPEAHGRVVMLALLDPSRQDIPEYAEYLAMIQREARRVNDRFQRESWTPIQLEVADNFPQSVAAYKQFDVLLVNAIFDGLNLVAKEAPLVNRRDGVLVLSRGAGAFAELEDWVIGIDPLDVAGQAEALERAVDLPRADRRAWLDAIRAHVRAHDLDAWATRELVELERRAPCREAGATMRS